MKTGISASARNRGSSARRHQTPSAMIISMSTAPSMFRVAGDIALLGGHVEHGREPFPDVGIERRRDARDLRIAPGFGHDFGAELHLLDRANGEVVTRHAFEHGKKPL